MLKANFNYLSSFKQINKIWNVSIGSCHAYTLLRSDVREQLKIGHDECGFKYVRCHGIFLDQMHVVSKDYNGKIIYSFFNIDNIYDYLLSIGMKPFVELSFMPEVLASKDSHVFHYKGNTSLPKDFNEWDNFIKAFISHLIKRYGLKEVQTWFFEVWNEPNLGGDIDNYGTGFFNGTQKDYFNLYDHTAKAIKSVNNTLKVGGPATSNNQWITDFINHCENNNIPCDFISTHHYPSDVIFGDNCEGGKEFKRLQDDLNKAKDKKKAWEEFNTFKNKLWNYIPKFTTIEMSEKVKSQCKNYPLYFTEQSSLSGIESDEIFGAAYVMEINLRNMFNCNGYSYWCLSDIFEEGFQEGREFHGGFGIFTYHGLKKSVFNAFKLLNKLEGKISTEIYENDALTIRLIKGDKKDYIIITNYDGLNHQQINYTGEVIINNYLNEIKDIEAYLIDENHSNVIHQFNENKYQDPYLSQDQIKGLKRHDYLYNKKITNYMLNDNKLTIPFSLNGWGVIAFEIKH